MRYLKAEDKNNRKVNIAYERVIRHEERKKGTFDGTLRADDGGNALRLRRN